MRGGVRKSGAACGGTLSIALLPACATTRVTFASHAKRTATLDSLDWFQKEGYHLTTVLIPIIHLISINLVSWLCSSHRVCQRACRRPDFWHN